MTLTPGRMVGPYDEREPFLPDNPIERRYAVRERRARLHQARFRARVLPAYANQCAICRLKETRLLDAAHIVGDLEETGLPVVSNGLNLLLEDEDGPMLELLKKAHATAIQVPKRKALQPDRELLAVRFDAFQSAA